MKKLSKSKAKKCGIKFSELSLANCYFVNDLSIPALLRFFDAPFRRSFHPVLTENSVSINSWKGMEARYGESCWIM